MPETDPERIAVFGQSLGGAIALSMVAAHPAKDRLAALVVEGAFSDYRAIAREKLGSFWLTWVLQWPLSLTIDGDLQPGRCPPRTWLRRRCSSSTVSATRSCRRPMANACSQAAGEPKTIWRPEDAGHIQALATVEMRDRLTAWLRSRFQERAGGDG